MDIGDIGEPRRKFSLELMFKRLSKIVIPTTIGAILLMLISMRTGIPVGVLLISGVLTFILSCFLVIILHTLGLE